jgi:heme A synthase
MLIKLVIIALLLFIIANLVRAGLVMLKQPQPDVKMSRFLGRRVMFSAVVLLLIFIAQALGLIEANPRPY